jgi:hypothetical protein
VADVIVETDARGKRKAPEPEELADLDVESLALQREGWANWPLLLVLVFLQQEHHPQEQSWVHVFITYVSIYLQSDKKGHQDTNSGRKSSRAMKISRHGFNSWWLLKTALTYDFSNHQLLPKRKKQKYEQFVSCICKST